MASSLWVPSRARTRRSKKCATGFATSMKASGRHRLTDENGRKRHRDEGFKAVCLLAHPTLIMQKWTSRVGTSSLSRESQVGDFYSSPECTRYCNMMPQNVNIAGIQRGDQYVLHETAAIGQKRPSDLDRKSCRGRRTDLDIGGNQSRIFSTNCASPTIIALNVLSSLICVLST